MKLVDRVIMRLGVGLVRLAWIRRGGWLAQAYPRGAIRLKSAPFQAEIESISGHTNDLVGRSEAWQVYEGSRTPNEVRSAAVLGQFYADLVRRRGPGTVLEFGSAFGVSGMYWVGALEASGNGHLYSFEVNPAWAKIARQNIAAISDRCTLTVGTYEDHADSVAELDITFIDAVHTRDWVVPQFDIVVAHSASGALILIDDIDFSEDMRSCWREISTDIRVVSSLVVSDHLGVVELA